MPFLAFVVRRIRIIVCRMWAKRLQSLRMRDQVFPTTELLGTTPRKYAILPCGNLDFESAVTAQNDEFKGSFHSSHPRLLNASTLSDTFVKCICRNLSCAPGKWRLHSSRRSSSRLSESSLDVCGTPSPVTPWTCNSVPMVTSNTFSTVSLGRECRRHPSYPQWNEWLRVSRRGFSWVKERHGEKSLSQLSLRERNTLTIVWPRLADASFAEISVTPLR